MSNVFSYILSLDSSLFFRIVFTELPLILTVVKAKKIPNLLLVRISVSLTGAVFLLLSPTVVLETAVHFSFREN